MKSQEAQILEHLKAGNTLTPIEALKMFDSFRLGARIHRIKEAGHTILTKLIKTNTNKIIAQYSFENVDTNGQYKLDYEPIND